MKQIPVFVLSCMLGLVAQPFAMGQTMIGLPDQSVTLSGEPSQPVIHNNTNHRIIVYALRFEETLPNGDVIPWTSRRSWLLDLRNRAYFNKELTATLGIPAHGQRQFNRPHRESNGLLARVLLDGVVFEDGEFVGPNLSASYEGIVAGQKAQRDLYNSVLANKAKNLDSNLIWKSVQKMASDQENVQANVKADDPGRTRWNYTQTQQKYAQELLRIKGLSGEKVAYQVASEGLKLPTIWRSK